MQLIGMNLMNHQLESMTMAMQAASLDKHCRILVVCRDREAWNSERKAPLAGASLD